MSLNIIGKKNYFITLSVILIVSGLISIIFQKGLKLGIDFVGGTNITVKFIKPVTTELLNKIRIAFKENGIEGNLQVLASKPGEEYKIKISTASISEIENKISSVLKKNVFNEAAIDDTSKMDINMLKSKIQILETLQKVYISYSIDTINSVKPVGDIKQLAKILAPANLTEEELGGIFIFTQGAISDTRKNINSLDNESLTSIFSDIFSSTKYKSIFDMMADEVIKYVDAHGGIVRSVDELAPVLKIDAKIFEKFKSRLSIGSFIIESQNSVGAAIGKDYRNKAFLAVIFSLIGMLLYIAWRFEFEFAIGAVIALFHDVIITIGIFSILGKEFNTQILAAILTLIGYSLNDTIVVYDRIRENIKSGMRGTIEEIINTSIISTFSRTIMTSLTTLFASLALWLWGGIVIADFALALTIGIVIGTYSSIFIASPFVIFYKNYKKAKAKTSPVRK